jgi:hypothetical protein
MGKLRDGKYFVIMSYATVYGNTVCGSSVSGSMVFNSTVVPGIWKCSIRWCGW